MKGNKGRTTNYTLEADNLESMSSEDLEKLDSREIDYSDIPAIDDQDILRLYKPLKKQISIKLDADVLEWFKSTYRKYQPSMNKVLRQYMTEHLATETNK